MNNTKTREPIIFECDGRLLDLVAVLRNPVSGKDADTIIIHPSLEPDFGRAAKQLAVAFLRMDDNGFDFTFDGKRIKVRTDSEMPLNFLRFGNLRARNFRGVNEA